MRANNTIYDSYSLSWLELTSKRFSAAAPQVWKELPTTVYRAASVNGFNANLKTSLPLKFQLTLSYVCASAPRGVMLRRTCQQYITYIIVERLKTLTLLVGQGHLKYAKGKPIHSFLFDGNSNMCPTCHHL